MARACSVLQFHAISTLVPICRGGDGGHRSIGRPLSNKPDGSKGERTDWFRVTAWRGLAEVCNQYLTKGRPPNR